MRTCKGKARRASRNEREKKASRSLSLFSSACLIHSISFPACCLKKPRFCCVAEIKGYVSSTLQQERKVLGVSAEGRGPREKGGRHCQLLDVVAGRRSLSSSSSRLPHFIPATAPPRLTGPGPAAAWLVAVAAAEAAAVQATLRRLERDRERRRGSKAQRSLSLSRNFMSATVFLTSMR